MAHGRRTRIVIVDDSAVMRSLLRTVISADPSLEVAGSAADGAAALQTIQSVRPDLVLLDVEMPNLGGLETLRILRARGSRTPVVMVSAVTQRGARVTIDALASGASDYVTKPFNQTDRDSALRTLAQDLLPKIQALTVSSLMQLPRPPLASESTESQRLPSISPSIVVIGVSTGGPVALDALLSSIPSAFPLPILIVQHMPELFTGPLAERLSHNCRLRVCEATEGAPVLPGSVFLARGNWHMAVMRSPRQGTPAKLHLQQEALENHCRPSVDVLFRSAVAAYGPATLAVVLTGMGSDGLASSRLIRAQGGMVLAQDQATSAVWGMPGAVVQAGIAQRVLPLTAIAPEIIRLASPSPSELFESREWTVQR